jgi:hypothetical protein
MMVDFAAVPLTTQPYKPLILHDDVVHYYYELDIHEKYVRIELVTALPQYNVVGQSLNIVDGSVRPSSIHALYSGTTEREEVRDSDSQRVGTTGSLLLLFY